MSVMSLMDTMDMPGMEPVNWYEASLPLGERKRRGHFSTPPSLVAWILDACGYCPKNDLSCLRVLDPACGGGNFLAGAARRLAAFAARAGLCESETAALVARNLWGFDPDPVSCFLAEMNIRAYVPARLHIHQADGLAFPWEGYEEIDLFLANPPYLAAKNSDLSGYRSTRQSGQMDSYLLFLALALAVVRPGGWLGLVLPDPVLARGNASRQRTRLLESCTITHLWHLSGVFAAHVGAVVLIAQKRPAPAKHLISWQRAVWSRGLCELAEPDVQDKRSGWQERRGETFSTVPQSLFQRQPGAQLRYLLSSERGALMERLRIHLEHADTNGSERCFAPLSDFLTIRRGEELGRKSELLVQTADSDHFPVLLGGMDVKPYGTPVGNCWLAGEAVEKPLERYLAPKLLVVKSTGRLQAALDVRGHVVLQTLYLLQGRAEAGVDADDLYFFLALLNSRLLCEYVYVLHTAYKWVQPQIEQHVLACLPVPLGGMEEKRAVIERAKRLMEVLELMRRREVCSEAGAVVELKQQWQGLYDEQERAVGALYAAALG